MPITVSDSDLAAARGATVSGIDIAPGMLGVAASRVPNAFQFALDPLAAIVDGARVLAPRGRLSIGMFAEPERAESSAIHLVMTKLSPPARAADHAPYPLSALEPFTDPATGGVLMRTIFRWIVGVKE